jgi:hypothetical protein
VAYGRRNGAESYQARIDKKSKNSYFDAYAFLMNGRGRELEHHPTFQDIRGDRALRNVRGGGR